MNAQNSIRAVVMVSSREIAPAPPGPIQSRPSASASDYLETEPTMAINNAAGSGTYGKAKAVYSPTFNFNDRVACLRAAPIDPCP